MFSSRKEVYQIFVIFKIVDILFFFLLKLQFMNGKPSAFLFNSKGAFTRILHQSFLDPESSLLTSNLINIKDIRDGIYLSEYPRLHLTFERISMQAAYFLMTWTSLLWSQEFDPFANVYFLASQAMQIFTSSIVHTFICIYSPQKKNSNSNRKIHSFWVTPWRRRIQWLTIWHPVKHES